MGEREKKEEYIQKWQWMYSGRVLRSLLLAWSGGQHIVIDPDNIWIAWQHAIAGPVRADLSLAQMREFDEWLGE